MLKAPVRSVNTGFDHGWREGASVACQSICRAVGRGQDRATFCVAGGMSTVGDGNDRTVLAISTGMRPRTVGRDLPGFDGVSLCVRTGTAC